MVLIITLFKLREGRRREDYADFTRTQIAPDMLRFPSVIAFGDGVAAGGWGTVLPDWDGVEVIQVDSTTAFESDQETHLGREVGQRWLTWVDEYQVNYFDMVHVPELRPARG